MKNRNPLDLESKASYTNHKQDQVALVIAPDSDFDWVLCKSCGKKLFRILRKSRNDVPQKAIEVKCRSCKHVAQYP